ncbi:MAG: bidirectional hydrogenase complex protein HoxU [Planctomycetia bacterium]|nr:MAG: bidirectional hydrogenase complex protein HoxU [Planctomycetia bacterium]
MAETVTLTIDGKAIQARPGQKVIEAADAAGIYIPRLCHKPGLEPFGSCRVCTVLANGRPCSACTTPVLEGMVVASATEAIRRYRKMIVEMLFVEGNHFCMFCEKSGDCELQAVAYRLGITAPRFPLLWPKRQLDASHGDIMIDHNRCILCARCVRTSRDLDGKHVFDFVGRGRTKRLGVNAAARLADTEADVADQALDACPVGALLRKRVGYQTPIGQRLYDLEPIGSTIENANENAAPAGEE